MSEIRDKRFHLIWNNASREIILEYEAENPRTVTYWSRLDLSGSGYDLELDKDAKIESDRLIRTPSAVTDPGVLESRVR